MTSISRTWPAAPSCSARVAAVIHTSASSIGATSSRRRGPKIVAAGELPDDAFIVSIAGVGAPTVIVEHLVSTNTLLRLLESAESFYGRKVDALISAEIGGLNSMFPLALGARAGIPVVDADGMGRAFPHLEMTTFGVYGVAATPSVLMDDSGNVVHVRTTTNRIAEDVVRAVLLAGIDDLRQLLLDVRAPGQAVCGARNRVAHARNRRRIRRAGASRRWIRWRGRSSS